MKKLAFGCLAVVASVAQVWAGSYLEPASASQPSFVVPSDNFSFCVAGFDANYANNTFLVSPLTATFGGTQNFAGSGPTAGQTVTVTSSESVGATTTTDTLIVSVPSNFAPAGTRSSGGTVLTRIYLEFGGYDAGNNPLDFLTALNSPTYFASILYGPANQTVTYNPDTVTVGNNGRSLAAFASIYTSDNSDIDTQRVRSFTFSVTYSNVPEPSTCALLGVGILGAGIVTLRRRRLYRAT